MDELTEQYFELYTRNIPMITSDLQRQISKIKIAVAGCGSTGGAFIDGALRLGVQSFHLTDNGEYEINNLNRQMVDVSAIGKNKAVVYGEKVLSVNKEACINVWNDGFTPQNMEAFLSKVDFLFDAVDVTTEKGMQMKILLHEKAAEKKIPTGSALDLGLTQWLQSYNYHQGEAALKGKLNKAKNIKNPLKALFAGFVEVEELNEEITEEVIRILSESGASVCQLASACFLLSSMVTPYLIYFLKNKKLPDLTVVDIESYFFKKTQVEYLTKRDQSHKKLKQLLETIT